MLQREKRSDGTKLWIQWQEKQSCVISQLNWLLMFLNILNVSVYVLNLTFFFLFSETEDFFISRLGLNNNTTETNRSMRDVCATLAGHVTPPGVYEWTGKSCHVLPISHMVKYACVFSCGGVGRGLKSTLTLVTKVTKSYKTYIYRLKIFLYESDRQTLLPYLWACAILTYSQTYMISDTAEAKQINVTTLRLLLVSVILFWTFAQTQKLCKVQQHEHCAGVRESQLQAKNRLHGKASNY